MPLAYHSPAGAFSPAPSLGFSEAGFPEVPGGAAHADVCARVHRLVARANFARMQTDVCARRAPNLGKHAETLKKHKNTPCCKKAQRYVRCLL